MPYKFNDIIMMQLELWHMTRSYPVPKNTYKMTKTDTTILFRF